MLNPSMDLSQKSMINKVFPNESELKILQSTVKQVGTSELLANDLGFLQKMYNFIE